MLHPMEKLTPTRERFTYEEGEIQVEHYHRYQLASALVAGKGVLDIASGEGYGSNLLAKTAKSVIGVDIAGDCVRYANKRYGRTNLEYRQGEAAKIPVEDNCVDIVVSFETIEHHDKHEEMLQEIRRVLVPGGIMVMSSPDKKYYSDVPGFQNEYHVKELYFEEFQELVSRYFRNARFYFQRMVKGSLIIPGEFKFDGFTVYSKKSIEGLEVEEEEFAQLYEICVASDSEIPTLDAGLFDGEAILQAEFDRRLRVETDKFLNVVNSPTWKVGNAVLSPLKWLRKLFGQGK